MQSDISPKSNEDSEEIAAALAAVYALIQSEQTEADLEEPQPSISAWGQAARMESIKPSVGKIVSNSQIKGQFFTWRNSYARRWTALSIAIVGITLNLASPVLAFERIQFDPNATPAKPVKPSISADSEATANEVSDYKQPLCPIAPPMVLLKSAPQLAPNFRQKSPLLIQQVSAASQTSIGANQQGNAANQQSNVAIPQSNAAIQQSTAAYQQSTTLVKQSSQLLQQAVQPAPQSIQAAQQVSLPLQQGVQSVSPEIAFTDSTAGKTIKIALSTNATTADIIVPDGAQIIDEAAQTLLAELPPQSRWQLTIENSASTASGKRLAINGKTGNAHSSRVLLASGTRKYEAATYTRKFSASSKGGFSRPPQVIDADNAKFYLPVKSVPVLTAAKDDDLKPVSFQTSPLPLNNSAKSISAPPVVSGYLVKPSNPDGVISFAGKTYRGSLLIKPRTAEQPSFIVINLLDLEDYLLSVVPSEMPSAWNPEALKAQTIAARSYALSNLGKHQSEGYDLKASTEDQVYLGVQTESDSCNKAVANTRGLVLKHKGKVVTAFFHSAGGGATEQSEHVYGSKLPYLKSVPDFDDQSPHFNWNRSIPVANIEENLRKQGRDIGGILGIFPLERSPSQRVTTALISGTLQTLIVSGEDLRRILALPSTVFNLGSGPDAYLVAGRGFGHGLGMSQWGAKFLSEQGYNASQILSYYYKDVSVDQF